MAQESWCNMKQLICFDVDGTLNDPNTHQVSSSCIDALHKLREQGYLLAIATGRNIKSVSESGFADLIDWDAYICDNGISVLDRNKTVLFQDGYPQSFVLNAIKIAEDNKLPIVYQNDEGQFLIGEITKNVINAHNFFHEPLPIIKAYDNDTVLMMAVYDDYDAKYEMFDKIPTLSIALSQSTYADLIQCNVNKYVGIKKLLDYLNIEEYIAFGDSMNDLEMLQHATCSILMGQGDKELIPYVDFITKAVDQDGIYYACKTLSLF